MLGRRQILLGAASALGGTGAWQGAAGEDAPNLAAYRPSFVTRFDDPAAPLFVKNGGPFTTRYEEWGGLRTLPANKELELYVDPAFVPAANGTDSRGIADAAVGGEPLGYNPFALQAGALEITAVPTPPVLRALVDRPYLAGMLSTEWSFTQRFGYFEMRAQLPAGKGLWPAFWLVSKTAQEHIEVDVMEALGNDTKNIYQSVHLTPARGRSVHERVTMPGAAYDEGMHDYGVLWTEDALVFYVDGRETLRTTGSALRNAPPMYMIVNLAVGGSWGGNPDAGTHFPAVMRIRHLRAYTRT